MNTALTGKDFLGLSPKVDSRNILMKNPEALGTHSISDLFNCHSRDINDPNYMEEVAIKTAKETRGTILGKMQHVYSPFGLSIVVFIAESHLSIHTWPEYGFVAVDIFTCGRNTDPLAGEEFLKETLKPSSCKSLHMQRGWLSDVGNFREVPNVHSASKTDLSTIDKLKMENEKLKRKIIELERRLKNYPQNQSRS